MSVCVWRRICQGLGVTWPWFQCSAWWQVGDTSKVLSSFIAVHTKPKASLLLLLAC